MSLGLPNTYQFGWFSATPYQASADGWAFDPLSFVIGAIFAFALAILVYHYRHKFAQLWDRLRAQTTRLRQRLTASMATRYSTNTIETAQARHLFATLAEFGDIYVETWLYPPLAPAQDSSNALSFTPSQAIDAADRIVVIGRPGSGRTALLNHLLLQQAGKVHQAGEKEQVPVYVYLPVMVTELRDLADADAADITMNAAAETLVKVTISSMSRVVATGVARWLRRQIEAGNALILLDGWDELPATDRPTIVLWIQELLESYSGLRVVLTAGERGYAPFIELGFVLMRPALWKNRQFEELARRWHKAWSTRGADSQASLPSITYTLTPPSPFEATIELIIKLRELVPARTPAGQMRQALDLLLAPMGTADEGFATWPSEVGDHALRRLALTALEQSRITLSREEIQATVTELMPLPLDLPEEEENGETAGEVPKATREDEEYRALQIADCCRALTAPGAPVRSWDSQLFYFAHPLIAAFLAARELAFKGIPIEDCAEDRNWSDALSFYAGLASAESIVKRLLSVPDDVFLQNLWTAASLLTASPPGDEPWRSGLMARLGQLFLNPRMPSILREPCLIALVESGEDGVGILFRQAAGSPEAPIRAGAILGLGARGDEQDLALIDGALGDPDPQVRLATIDALDILARMGNQQAMELIVSAMIEGEDQVQRIAVDALAELGPEGHDVLREAVKDEDLIVRRAAIYGLASIGEPWAIEVIRAVQRDDEEWLVRNAAVQALASFDQSEDGEPTGVEMTPPRADSEPWLISWAAERGEGTGVGDAALTTLLRALQEGDQTTRLLALDTLRRLGDPRTVDVLRQRLRDPDPAVRVEALVALDEISRRHDLTITMS
jgi:HEAT repeat protein